MLEITELMGVLCQTEKLLRKKLRRQCQSPLLSFELITELQDRLDFYDICSGKGIASFFICLMFPLCKITLVDFDNKINFSYLETPRLLAAMRRVHMDIYLPSFEDFMREESVRIASQNRILIMYGSHLCGTLSSRLLLYMFCLYLRYSLLLL